METKYYAQIYGGTGRPTGLIVKASSLDIFNHVLMNRFVPLIGETEEEAYQDLEDSTYIDDRGFTQWEV